MGTQQSQKRRDGGRAREAALEGSLVARARGGDEKAFGEIVTLHWDRIYGVALQLLRNEEDAEEVTQDTFVRAHRSLADFRGEAALSTWLYRIAMNLARNRYWQWWRRRRLEPVSIDEPVGKDGMSVAEVVAAEEAPPDGEALNRELLERIEAGMGRLGKKHREILVLRNVKGLSYEDIGAILGVSVGTVKSRIARARENLRKKMMKKI
jgi:RNA polymerase sigma-70 factor (ECF subfamily)